MEFRYEITKIENNWELVEDEHGIGKPTLDVTCEPTSEDMKDDDTEIKLVGLTRQLAKLIHIGDSVSVAFGTAQNGIQNAEGPIVENKAVSVSE